MRSPSIRCASAYAMLVLVAALSGCPKPGPVLETLDEMERITRTRGHNDRAELRRAVIGTFEVARLSAEDRVSLKLEEMKVYLYQTTEQRIDQLTKTAIGQLEEAMEDLIGRLDDEVQAARAKRSTPANRSEELEAATALSATLAALGREEARLIETIRSRFTVERDAQIAALEARRDSLKKEVGIDPEAEADALLAQYMKSSELLDTEMEAGYANVRRYVTARDSAISNFSKGLLGEKFGRIVASKATELADEGVAKVSGRIERLARDAAEKIGQAEDTK